MKRSRLALLLALTAVSSTAHAAETRWFQDVNAGGFRLYNLAAPVLGTAAVRLQDVAVGACIPKWSGVNGTASCAIVNTDYLTPAYTLGGQLSGTPASANVIGVRETGGPTLLTIGAIPDGALFKRSGSTLIGATSGTDFLLPGAITAGNYDRVSVATTGLVTGNISLTVANVAALEALPGANYRDGSVVRVQSLATDFAYHETSSATVDDLTVASVSGVSGARWIRSGAPVRYFWEPTTWYINPSLGSDQAAGTATGAGALATWGELMRRLRDRVSLGTLTVNIEADLGSTDHVIVDFETGAATQSIVLVGQQGVAATATVTAVVSGAGFSTNVLPTITAESSPGVPFDWSTYVGRVVRLQGTSGATGTYAVVVANLGSGTAAFGQKTVSGAFSNTGWSVSDVLEVVTFTRVPSIVLRQGASSIIATDLNVAPASGTSTIRAFNNGTISLTRCNAGLAASTVTAVGASFAACGFNTIGVNMNLSGSATRSAFTGSGFVSTSNNASFTFSSVVFYGTRFLGGTGGTITFTGSANDGVGVYGLTTGQVGITCSNDSFCAFNTYLFGASNSATSYVLGQGRTASVANAGSAGIGTPYFFAETSSAGAIINAVGSSTNGDPIPLTAYDAYLGNMFRDGKGPTVTTATNITLPGLLVWRVWALSGAGTVNYISQLDQGQSQVRNGTDIEIEIPAGVSFTNTNGLAPPAGYATVVCGTGVLLSTCSFPTGGSIKFRFNKNPFGGGIWYEVARTPALGSSVSLTATQIAYGSATDTMTSDAAFTVDATTRAVNIGAHAAASAGAAFAITKSRGTVGSPAAVTTADYLGRYGFRPYTGTQYLNTAQWGAHATGTITSSSVPTHVYLNVSATGVTDPYAASAAVAMRALSNSRVQFGTPVDHGDTGTMLTIAGGTTKYGLGSSQFTHSAVEPIFSSRGTITSPTATTAGDQIYAQRFYAYDSGYLPGLLVTAYTIGAGSGGSIPMVWNVAPSQSGSLLNAAALLVQSTFDVGAGHLQGQLTSDTTGFFWLPKMPGAPVGTPAGLSLLNGTPLASPLVLDTTNDQLWVYNTAWRRYGQFTGGLSTGYLRNTITTGLWSVVTTIPYADISGAPSAITALTGDATASGPGSAAITFATVNSNVGTFTNGTFTVNGKGLITAASSGTAPVTSVSGTASNITSTGGTTPVLNLATTTVTPGSYTATNLTVDSFGRITAASNGSSGGGGTVTSVSGTATRISSTGGAAPVIDLISTAVTPGTYTYMTGTVDGYGRLTSASSGATPAPVGATYITQTANATLTGEQALDALTTSGVMLVNESTGLVSSYGAGTARVLRGSGTAGGLTDSDNFAFNRLTFGLGSIQEAQIYNDSTSTTALAGVRVCTDAPCANSFTNVMLGTNWSGGSLAPNGALVELNAGSAPLFISNLGVGGKISFVTGVARTERASITTAGVVNVVSLAGSGVRMVGASTGGDLQIATAGTHYQAPITWPTAAQVLVSSATTTAPVGDAAFTYNTSTDTLTNTGHTVLGNGSATSYLSHIASATVGAAYQAWKDATPTRAAGFGNSVPGTAPTDDAYISTYNGSTWTSRMMITSDGGGFALNGTPITSLHSLTLAPTSTRDRVWIGTGGVTITTGNTEFMTIDPADTSVTTTTAGLIAGLRVRGANYNTSSGGGVTLAAGLYVDQPSVDGAVSGPGHQAYTIYGGGGTASQAKFEGSLIANNVSVTSTFGVGANNVILSTTGVCFPGVACTGSGIAIQTVSGSRGGNAALTDLIASLAMYGLIIDGTTP